MLFIVVAMAGAVGITSLQSTESSLEAAKERTAHQNRVIARQIAWSGFNAILARARVEGRQGQTAAEVVGAVDPMQAQVEKGRYEAWLEEDNSGPGGGGPPGGGPPGQDRGTYYVVSEGTFQGITVRIRRLRQLVTNGNGGGGPPGGGPPGGGPPGGGPPGNGPSGNGPPGQGP